MKKPQTINYTQNRVTKDKNNMKTVNDYINSNYPDLEVIIEGRNPDNECDSYAPTYYRGSLANIPVRLRSCDVLDQAWSLSYDLPILEIPFQDNNHLI